MTRFFALACTLAVGLTLCAAPAFAQTVLLSEDFDSLDLEPNYWEPNGAGPGTGLVNEPNAYTHTPPAGWTNDQSLVPTLPYSDVGVPEWEGWSFAKKDWWVAVAGDQDRSDFVLGTGTVAVFDGDEWNDRSDAGGNSPDSYGFLEGSMFTPAIDISSITPGTGQITFDSSWWDEDMQSAQINVSFDGGTSYQTIMNWVSDSQDPDYKANASNETVVVRFTHTSGDTTAKFEFRGYNTADDWWWAVDNIKVGDGTTDVFTEDFESCTLGPPAWEPSGAAMNPYDVEDAYTHTTPADWSIDNDMPAGGVPEWEGWSFTDKEFWATVAGDQDRTMFTLGQNTVAVADPDEWDDSGPEDGTYNTTLNTPSIDVAGYSDLTISFDSSWRPEDEQKVKLTAEFDNGSSEELMLWNSYEGDPNYHPNAQNESLSFDLSVPSGAGEVVFKFEMFDAGNDWWWALDNIEVTGSAQAGLEGDFNLDGSVDVSDLGILATNYGATTGMTLADGDANGDGAVDVSDLGILATHYGSTMSAAVPEPASLALLLGALLSLSVLRRRSA